MVKSSNKSVVEAVFYHLWTLFLFTKSDIKTVILPITVFGATTAPLASISNLPHVAAWLWIQLLSFDIANQALFIEEDRANKPYRPIPSGRISVENAFRLRYAVLVIGFIHSAYYSLEMVGVAVGALLAQLLYSDLRLDATHWALRNIMGGLVLSPCLLGATLLAGGKPYHLDNIGTTAFLLSTAITLSTFHCQDFKDVEGDSLVGRKTFPMVYPNFSRVIYMVAVIIWSFVSSTLFRLDSLMAGFLVSYAMMIGLFVVTFRSVKADQLSYKLFEVWQTLIFTMPAYYRYKFNDEPLADVYQVVKAFCGGP